MGGGKKVCAWLLANCEVQLCSALAAMSLLGVVVVCPVMLDPAIETLASSFEEAQCQTVYSRELRGLSNCTWTSCREGCTADIYECWHIVVVYMKDSMHPPKEENSSPPASPESRLAQDDNINIEDSYNNHNNNNASFMRNNSNSNNINNTIHNNLTSSSSISSSSSGSVNRTEDRIFQTTLKIHSETTVSPLTTTKWSLSAGYNFDYFYDYSFSRNISRGLNLLLEEINRNLKNDSKFGLMGIGALFPNQQKCVYPSETVCIDYFKDYGRVGGNSFRCYVSTSNSTMVVTTVDKVGALRNIFYCFIPLVIASGVFTYLFYRVGLICGGRQRLKGDEEEADENKQDDSRPGKNGLLPNGAPPGAPKKFRKKFLPKRKDSSKKRRQRKGLKKNAMSIKNQLSVKSASSSRRTPSISMGDISYQGEGYGYGPQRTSVPKL